MSDSWLYTCALAEKPMLLFTLIITVFGFWSVRNQYLCTVYFLFPSVTSISSQFLNPCSRESLHLVKALLYGMSILLITEKGGIQNHSGHGTYDRDFVSKLIFLMLLTFTDALDIRFVNGINLLSRITTL